MHLCTLGQGGFSQCNEVSYMLKLTLYRNDEQWMEIDYHHRDNYSSQWKQSEKERRKAGAKDPVILLFLFLSLDSTTWLIFTYFAPSKDWVDFSKGEQLWWIAATFARRRGKNTSGCMHMHTNTCAHTHPFWNNSINTGCRIHAPSHLLSLSPKVKHPFTFLNIPLPAGL